MTHDEIKKMPLRKGDFLYHGILGIVAYRGKVNGGKNPGMITIEELGNLDPSKKGNRWRVHIHDVTRHAKRSGKRQGTRLILAHCEHCQLKIRVSQIWLSTGSPRCFNTDCPAWNPGHMHGPALTIEWGEQGDGFLGTDMSVQATIQQHERHGTTPNWEK